MTNEKSLDTLCAALAYAIGVDAPECAASASSELCEYVDKSFGGKKADRILMYNPDAIAQWVYEKYPQLLDLVKLETELALPFCSVMPSVTPVCFGTMYTGAQPEVHGIRKYEKPVIKIDTLFDALIRAGKKPVIIAQSECSMSKIYLEREMDYFIYDSIDEVNAKAAEVIMNDEYDFVAVYNGNYDARMHKFGPESIEALGELRSNARTFATLCHLVKKHWKSHDTLVGFAMDHGCHELDSKEPGGKCGSHGLDMDEDLNIVHLYRTYPAEK